MSTVFDIISQQTISNFIEKAKNVRVMLLGDLCVDIYWTCDMTKSVLSRETPHFPLPVIKERMSLGAGGNVANCVKALGVENLCAVGVIHDDWRGNCLKDLFHKSDISDRNVAVESGGFTNTYIKPMQRGYSQEEVEGARIDFEESSDISYETEEHLLEALEREVGNTDVMVVSDQFEHGIVTERIRARLREYARNGLKITVDSRSRIDKYSGALLKPNEIECSKAVGAKLPTKFYASEYRELALRCSEKLSSSVCMTMGAHGAYIADRNQVSFIPAIVRQPPFDTVGAGDCFLSAFSVAYACGFPLYTSAFIGNMASSIIIKKIGTTGTASPEEILELYNSGAEVADERE